ncbi:hypothetical protein TWF569_011808 [Orbilia oligospora]|uniref:Uncharacterized protein n=1 Tax=Orbilia oligospora TaxID=2813651 RepID=A0A7C8JBT6_ORBOL|nr:hypothetical protein TWF103_011260 [Orbilia oligospora]KAF3098726.1 hypothetical protein TWF706_006737 [Orbilia oligospora]KAF3099469.1 hypothetical protein TWF102_005444 [Orbilia oligospora]KAF3127191.1 hypothetical protein TWF569_011808 [Orbilia oligospora]
MQCWPLVKFSQDKYCLGLVWISKTFSKFFIANQQWIHFANPVRNSITSKVSKIAPIHTVGPPRSDNIIEPARLAGGAEAPRSIHSPHSFLLLARNQDPQISVSVESLI